MDGHEMNDFQMSSTRGEYVPAMCGYCNRWLDDGERDEHGRRGYCVDVQGTTYRTDWCHKPEEIEAHKRRNLST